MRDDPSVLVFGLAGRRAFSVGLNGGVVAVRGQVPYRKRLTGRAGPCLGCKIDDLAMDLFRSIYLPMAVDPAVIQENDRAVEERMASLRVYGLSAGCPTQAGVLAFAKDPLHWLSGAWIQFVRWAGTTMADDPIGERQFSGDLITVLREVGSFVSVLPQSRPVTESALRERMLSDYPVVAIRELLLNAIIREPHVEQICANLGLVLGDLGLSSFEARLSSAWPDCLGRDESAFRIESAFHRTILNAAQKQEADLVLIDVGPNLGAINRAAIIAANFVVFPLAPDLFSLQALRNVGPTLRAWRTDWRDRLDRRPQVRSLDLPSAEILPAGYIVMQHAVRSGRPVQAYQKWIQADSGGLQEGGARYGSPPTVLDRRQFRMPCYAQALS